MDNIWLGRIWKVVSERIERRQFFCEASSLHDSFHNYSILSVHVDGYDFDYDFSLHLESITRMVLLSHSYSTQHYHDLDCISPPDEFCRCSWIHIFDGSNDCPWHYLYSDCCKTHLDIWWWKGATNKGYLRV